MNKIIKWEEIPTSIEKVSTKNIIEKILASLEKNSYIGTDAVNLSAYGRFIKNLGEAIENHAKDEAIKHLKSENINVDVADMNVSFRENYDTIYPQDDQLRTYEELLQIKQQELKEIQDSVKNRKKQLELEGKTVDLLKSQSLIVRQK